MTSAIFLATEDHHAVYCNRPQDRVTLIESVTNCTSAHRAIYESAAFRPCLNALTPSLYALCQRRARRWQASPAEVNAAAAQPGGNGTLTLAPGVVLPIPAFYDELPAAGLPALEDVAASVAVLGNKMRSGHLRALMRDGGAALGAKAVAVAHRVQAAAPTLEEQLSGRPERLGPLALCLEAHRARQAAVEAAPAAQARQEQAEKSARIEARIAALTPTAAAAFAVEMGRA